MFLHVPSMKPHATTLFARGLARGYAAGRVHVRQIIAAHRQPVSQTATAGRHPAITLSLRATAADNQADTASKQTSAQGAIYPNRTNPSCFNPR